MTDKLKFGDIIRPDDDVPKAHDLLVLLDSRRGHYRLAMVDKGERLLMMAEFTSEELRGVIALMQQALGMNEPGGPPRRRPPHVVEIKP